MIRMKHKVLTMVLVLLLAFLLALPKEVQAKKGSAEAITYDTLLFDQSYVHEINVTISEEDWADLLAHPTSKTKYQTTVTIDGEEYQNVSFATKGNTSLTAVATSSSDRYGFKLNFGKFVDGQTYHGLKKINLSNIYADATYMKDYLSYEIFRTAGVNAPLTSYVSLSINGEIYGLYLAIEDIGKSYLNRTQDGKGELYKPDTGLDNLGDMQAPNGDSPEGESDGESPERNSPVWESEGESPSRENDDGNSPDGESNDQSPSGEKGDGNTPAAENTEGNSPNGESNGESPSGENGNGDSPAGPGGFGGNDGGASLSYIDDDPESYSGIFDNAETNVSEKDKTRIITALKNLSEGKVEDALNTDEVIRYFVAHNFVMNYDSYTGSMLHNYYLYERGGKLSMLPWDYNLAFGTFSNMDMGNAGATVTVNYGIDSPLSGATEESRPMWSWIVNDDAYLEVYHQVYDELLTDYFESGAFEENLSRIYEMIRPYVANDPTAFYTVEAFDSAYENLSKFCLLRAESIRKQLNGVLSAVTSEQDSEARVDASDVDISATGGMNMGFGRDGESEEDSTGDSDGDSTGDSDGNFQRDSDNAAPEGRTDNTGSTEQDAGPSMGIARP